MNTSNNIVNVHGATPYDIGVSLGRHIGLRLEHNINHYLSERPDPQNQINLDTFQKQALPWLRQLPSRFQDECEGLALK